MFALQSYSLDSITEPLDIPLTVPSDLAAILHKFRDVFSMPHGLPPPRAFDHTIHLEKGTPPVKVKPYRYLYSKKDEIEKMVQQMLDDGIIKPSSSPFSAPVILVKKKMAHGDFALIIEPLMQ